LLLARTIKQWASKHTLGGLVVWKPLLSNVDCVRPFANTFNIPNKVSEKLGKRFQKVLETKFISQGKTALLASWLVGVLFGMGC
jgi:hypothetical protein